jgi:pimeloyl-ACP methyl ester carboxylesterase
MMPNEHGRRLADAFPNGRLVELPDCYTLIPEDQPLELAAAMKQFLAPAEPAGRSNEAPE